MKLLCALLCNYGRGKCLIDVGTEGIPSKYWVMFPEYGYADSERPAGPNVLTPMGTDEAEFISSLFSLIPEDICGKRLCIDISGFVPPYLLFLIRYLCSQGVSRLEAVYAEPGRYLHQEETVFTEGSVDNVRQVAGFEGSHSTDTSNDLLVIGSGYDHKLIALVAEHKNNAYKVQMLGFPSLRADMYQENVLRAGLAADAVGGPMSQHVRNYFAPANDPFVTASVLQEIVRDFDRQKPLTNLYLSPIATKAQTLGCALYYLTEWVGRPASLILPFCRRHSREPDKGLARVWRYTVELPALP